MPQKRFYLRRCSRNERSSASLLNFRRNSRSRSKTFHRRSSLSYCSLTFFIRVWHYFHSFTALQRFSAMLNLFPCLGSQCIRVELTLGFAIFICIILSNRFILFLDLFSLSSRLPQELTLLLRTDRLFRSSLRVLLRVGLTLSFMILSYRDSLLQAEMKLELLCFFYFRYDLFALIELSNLLLLLQKEKSRFILDTLLEADEKEVSLRLFSFDFMQGWILSLRGSSYQGHPRSFLAFCRVVNRDIIAITDNYNPTESFLISITVLTSILQAASSTSMPFLVHKECNHTIWQCFLLIQRQPLREQDPQVFQNRLSH